VDEDDAGRAPVGSAGPMSERMQALLSRAAEEQLTEQRQVSMVLTDLRQLVTGIGEQLRGAASAARLDGLGDDVTAGLADLTARTGVLESMRDDVTAVLTRVAELASGSALTRTQDALASRLDQLEAAASRPTLTLEQLRSELVPVLARLTELEAARPVLERLSGLDGRLEVLEQRLSAVADRLADVGDAAGGVPSVAIDVGRLVGKVESLTGLPAVVADLRAGVTALRDDSPLPSLARAVAGLREDVADLNGQVGAVSVPSADAVAAAVTHQVTDRLLDELAPRVADLVLTRVATTLVEQVSGSVTTSIQDGLAERVRAATTDSERRISAHVDEAVLALAEALLRRRRDTRAGVLAALAPEVGTEAGVSGEPGLPGPDLLDDEPVAVAVDGRPDSPGSDVRSDGVWSDDSEDGFPHRPWWRPSG